MLSGHIFDNPDAIWMYYEVKCGGESCRCGGEVLGNDSDPRRGADSDFKSVSVRAESVCLCVPDCELANNHGVTTPPSLSCLLPSPLGDLLSPHLP